MGSSHSMRKRKNTGHGVTAGLLSRGLLSSEAHPSEHDRRQTKRRGSLKLQHK